MRLSAKPFLLLAALLLSRAAAAQDGAPPDGPAREIKKQKTFGDVMAGLGKGLLKEVGRRLNLDETSLVTTEIAPDGREKYRVDTGKFSFTVRKREKAGPVK